MSKNHTFESNGPDGKIRGTAQQVLDKYQALGRDATTSGDPVSAEGYFQHAEHFYRVLHANDGSGGERGPDRSRGAPDGAQDEGGNVEAGSGEQPAAEQPANGADRSSN